LENENFTSKFAKTKIIVRLSMASIKKKNANIIKYGKNKMLPCLHWSIQFPWGET
jgi:hypothetical protein